MSTSKETRDPGRQAGDQEQKDQYQEELDQERARILRGLCRNEL